MFSVYGQSVKLAGFYEGVSSDVAIPIWLPLVCLQPSLSPQQWLLPHTVAVDPFGSLIAARQMSGAIPLTQTLYCPFSFSVRSLLLLLFSFCFFSL